MRPHRPARATEDSRCAFADAYASHPRPPSHRHQLGRHPSQIGPVARAARASRIETTALACTHIALHSCLPKTTVGYFTDNYPLGARCVSFRYYGLMTVPGKGGRPRKWSSDADRVRAFRARARGDAEPATVVEVLDRGDEGATAWAQVRELVKTIEVQRSMIHALEHELRMTERSLVELTRRYRVLEGINERLRAQLADPVEWT